ncbi:chloride channel protein [Patescibacteria group bacterium]|nr:chloride channel protein [Patescibacteria group bacterium]
MPSLRVWFSKASPLALLVLALMVGVGGALGATVFHFLIATGTRLFYGDFGSDFIGSVESMPWWLRILIPAVGGLLVGILFKIARVREAEGEGVPEVVEALTLHQGMIRPIVAPVKIVAAALTLSSGGSAGREGPVIQIGSAIGSSVGQLFGMVQTERSLLLACGAAAAIGGTFGAPFAGVLFTIEILKHQPTFFRTGLIAVSALLGEVLTRLLTGHSGLRFAVEAVPSFVWWPDGAVVIVLGAAAALTALLFGMVLRAAQVIFARFPFPRVLRPALGGFVIGLISLYIPYIHEPAAYPLMVDLMALTTLPLSFLLGLFLMKMLATGVTLGSGGAGGIFAPSLLLGTILGSVFGSVAVHYGVLSPADAVICVVVGMAAVFAGAAHAPVTAALITYEIVGDRELIIPLLIGCFVATFLARSLKRESMYEGYGT